MQGESLREDEILKKVLDIFDDALKGFTRRLVVLEGDTLNKAELAGKIVRSCALYKKNRLSKDNLRVLYATDTLSQETFSFARLSSFEKVIEDLHFLKLTKISFKNSLSVLGLTFDFAILDLSYDLTPNDVGRLVETVSGGGLVIMLTPPFERWRRMWTAFHKTLLTPPYTLDNVAKRFNRRFISKLLEHDGILVINADENRIVKEPRIRNVRFEREKPRINFEHVFPRRLYELCATKDQVEALRAFEQIIDGGTLVLTADRGRGKSAVLGLGLVGLGDSLNRKLERKIRILVTSPELHNVRVLFEFAKLACENLEIRIRDQDKRSLDTSEFLIEYYGTSRVLRQSGDILAVDEAAGVDVPLLLEYLRFKRTIYSSTTHGYEGSGRGFSVKFMRKCREIANPIQIEMKEPIRYAPDDPVEKWLYDVLLLDSEPAKIDENDLKEIAEKELVLEKVDREKWFTDPGYEPYLKNFFGIYVLAHYRNRPNDVAILADAPHHFAYALLTRRSRKVVVALHLALEGGLSWAVIKDMIMGYRPKGNVIPDTVLKHRYLADFPRLKGWRIVRIATHPDLIGRGLGSLALRLLEEEAREAEIDWIGSSFGASEELIRFWRKNGYVPVHLSPERNPVSGEYSAIVLKPLNRVAEELIRKANERFRRRMLYSLHDTYFDLSPLIIDQLLISPWKIEEKLELNDEQLYRLRMYLKGKACYEVISDVANILARTLYLRGDQRELDSLTKDERFVLVAKCLQGRDWDSIPIRKAKSVLRDALERVCQILGIF